MNRHDRQKVAQALRAAAQALTAGRRRIPTLGSLGLPTTWYHGTTNKFDKLKGNNALGVVWLADREAAREYADKHYVTDDEKWVIEVELSSGLKVLDLTDPKEPFIDEMLEAINKVSPLFKRTKEDWVRNKYQYGELETYPWIGRWLRSRKIGGLILRDVQGWGGHKPTKSLALLSKKHIARQNRVPFSEFVSAAADRWGSEAQALRAAAEVLAARPIKLDKRALIRFVEKELMPQVVTSLELLAMTGDGDKPLGRMKKFAEAHTTVKVPGAPRYGPREVQVKVLVHSRRATGKKFAVLAGKARRLPHSMGLPYVEVTIYMNGALSPNEFLQGTEVSLGPMGKFKDSRLQPISKCTSDSCLPYGLYSLLTHEITHAAESVFGWGGGPTGTEVRHGETVIKHQGQYINNPVEVRAFMQQVVDEVLKYMRKPVFARRPPKEAMKLALKLSTTWSLIKDDLNTRNKNLILKAVYTVLQDEGLI